MTDDHMFKRHNTDCAHDQAQSTADCQANQLGHESLYMLHAALQ